MASVDPTALGEAIFARQGTSGWKRAKTHEIADGLDWSALPAYDGTQGTVAATAAQYRMELKERAAAGDRHAIDLLQGHANDDPGGS